MKKGLGLLAALLLVAGAYLSVWPVPIDPVAWHPPEDRGYVDPFASNDLLSSATGIDLGEYRAPEDATLGRDGIYVTTANGAVLRLRNRGVSEFARPGGKLLGIVADRDGSLLVANAYKGLQRISRDGHIDTLVDDVDGVPLVYTNNVDVAPDGKVYFTESSSKFGAEVHGGTYEASLLDIFEHGGHGRLFCFDPESGLVETLLSGLNFANGVAASEDGQYLIVAETGTYRIHKYWLGGDKAGSSEVLIDNLPGFPDNVTRGRNNRFWIGFAAPRNRIVDDLADKPFLRKLVQRLPAFVRPQAEPFSHVVAINGDGEVLMNMHDPNTRFPTLTGVLETRDALYLTSLFGNQLPRVAKRDLAY